MLLKVNPHKIEIVKSPVNEREINISKCTFEFADVITNDYVKEAYFTFGDTTYKQIIVNDECDFPSEVLTKKGTVEIGVVAYLVENETEIKRYNPSPAYFDTWAGSLKDNAENSEPITPNEMEQFEQALNDGLNEVNDKLDEIDQAIDDVNEAIIKTNNLDLDVDKQGKVATVTLTKKDASTKTVTLSDGTSLMFNWDGTKLGIKTDEDAEYTYVDLQGVQGPIGPKGEAFTIKKTYTSIAEMNADFNNMQLGDYVMIASTVEVEDNAKLYTRGETQWIFISDFSGATGIRGETGLTPNIQIGTVTSGATPNVTRTGTNENPIFNFTLVKGDTGATGPQGETGATGNGILSIQKTATAGLVDTYTIIFTDGTTTTFDVTNGEDGEVTQKQLDETNENVSWLQKLTEQMPHVAGQGTDLSLESVLNYRLMKFLPQGVSIQESTTGKNLLNSITDTTTRNGITFTKNSDGTYTLNGTSTSDIDFNIASDVPLDLNTSYILSGSPNTASNTTYRIMGACTRENDSTTYIADNDGSGVTIPSSKKIRVYINVKNGKTLNNVIFKPMIRLESITDDTYEPYTGGIPAPNPSYSIMPSRVTGENSLVICNENLFNKNSITPDSYLDSDGNIITNVTWSISDYIPVIAGEDYIYRGLTQVGNAPMSCYYDENKNFVSSFKQTTYAKKITIPAGVKYVRFTIEAKNTDDLNTFMLVKGATTPTTYIANQTQTYQLSLDNIELNSTPDGTIRDGIYGNSDVSYNLFDKNNANILNAGITSSTIYSSDNLRTLYMPIVGGKTYTISKILSSRFRIGTTRSIPIINTPIYNYINADSNKYQTISTTSEDEYLCVYYYLNGTDTLTEQEILDSIQITEGSEAKPYAPYGQVGMWWKREYIGKVVLNGSENWLDDNDNAPYRINISGALITTSNTELPNVLVDKFSRATYNSSWGLYSYLVVPGEKAQPTRLKFRNIDITSLEDWKVWLSENNVTVYYLKAQYTDIPITDTTLINQLNNIYNNAHSYNGVTSITTTYEDGNEQMYLDIEALKNVWDTSL